MANIRKRIHLLYGIVAAVLIVATGICLMAACLSIYRSGDRPFSPESIALAFDQIAWLVWLSIGAIGGGILLDLLLPPEKIRAKAQRSGADTLASLQKKAGTLTDEAAASAACKEEKLRKTLSWGAIAAIIAISLVPAIYFTDANRFTIANLNSDIIAAVTVLAIATAVSLALWITCVYVSRASIRREIAIYKAALAAKNCDGISPAHAMKKDSKNAILATRWAVAVLAVIFIVLGVMNEGILDVLGKAIAICTECIGLG